MSSYTENLTKKLLEDILYNEDGDMLETFPYVEKLSEYLGLTDAADLYNFLDSSLEYESLEDVEKYRDSMNDWEYDIYKLVFDKFGKYESDFTEEDLNKFGSNMNEYNEFHKYLNEK